MFLLVPAYPGCPGQKAVKRSCVCVCVRACVRVCISNSDKVTICYIKRDYLVNFYISIEICKNYKISAK